MKASRQDIPGWLRVGKRFRRSALVLGINFLGLVGMTVLYYTGFSFLFDTPTEYRMKQSTAELEKQYTALSARYDSIELAMQNVVDRDRNVFRILFEAEPYDFEGDFASTRWVAYERLLSKSNTELGYEFMSKAGDFENKIRTLETTYKRVETQAVQIGDQVLCIPAIQPVINDELTLLTASYGLRIQPFYKTLSSHQGVDYTIPVGSRVFATADGVVRDIMDHTTAGLTLYIYNGYGYETVYSNLDKVNVAKGARINRGDIIALSGNSGLSLAPHLHYEVLHNGMRVDPIHYFFMELSPDKYDKMIKIAQSGMQSFD